MCAVAGLLTIFLSTSKQQSALSSSNQLSVCVCVRFLSSCKRLCIWGLCFGTCSSLAVPQEGSVGLWAFSPPQPPSSHHNMEILTDLILSFSLLSLLCSLHSTPALPLVTSLVGVQLSENARGDTKRISGFRASNQIYYNFWVDVNLTIKNKCCARD